jgi:hypothetical protein
MSTVVFRAVTLYDLAGAYQRFGEVYRLHLQGEEGGKMLATI